MRRKEKNERMRPGCNKSAKGFAGAPLGGLPGKPPICKKCGVWREGGVKGQKKVLPPDSSGLGQNVKTPP